MKDHVLLKYMFLFDPEGTFATIDQFDKSLSDFFAAHGLEGQVVQTINNQQGERIFLLKKIEIMEAPKPPEPTFFKKEKPEMNLPSVKQLKVTK